MVQPTAEEKTRCGRVARHSVGLVCLTGLLLAGAYPVARADAAPPITVTGRWQGTVACHEFSVLAGRARRAKREVLVNITEHALPTASSLGSLSASLCRPGDDLCVPTRYSGLSVFDAGRRGQKRRMRVGLVVCTNNDVAGGLPGDEVVQLTAVQNRRGKTTLRGTSTLVSSFGLGTCRWKLQRVEAGDPGVAGACP